MIATVVKLSLALSDAGQMNISLSDLLNADTQGMRERELRKRRAIVDS